ncbi:MAG: molybdenum cofactor guanylyltransferase [Balneolaceae bacterium]|nr:molybdenum cofactor guanylyltransferase [Balneolaceae bacterium]
MIKSNTPLYIFCGGSSRRMGRDKAHLLLDGETLLNRQIRQASRFFDNIILLSGPNRYETSLRQIPDAIPDAGPLSGLLAALEDSKPGQEQIAVLPVDVPFVSDQTLQLLSSKQIFGQADAWVLRNGERIQPLAGIFTRAITRELRMNLQNGHRMVMKFLETLEVGCLNVGKNELRNINFPEDY